MLNKFAEKFFQNSEISNNLGIRSESNHYAGYYICNMLQMLVIDWLDDP